MYLPSPAQAKEEMAPSTTEAFNIFLRYENSKSSKMHTRKARPFVIEMTLAIKCNKRNLKIVNSAQRWVVMDVPRWPNLRVNSP